MHTHLLVTPIIHVLPTTKSSSTFHLLMWLWTVNWGLWLWTFIQKKTHTLTYHKHATNRAHLTSNFYCLRWVPQFSKFGIWIKSMAHLMLVLKSKMEILIEKSWPFHSCLYDCIGHRKLTTLTTNPAQSMFNQLLLHTWHWHPRFYESQMLWAPYNSSYTYKAHY